MKLKANELRINNWFNYGMDTSLLKPRQIRSQDIADFSRNSDKYQPIALTENWLLRFDFGRNDKYDKDFIGRYIDVANGFTLVDYCMEEKVLSIDLMGINCEFVHQLQNIWFALSGSELKLNEDD